MKRKKTGMGILNSRNKFFKAYAEKDRKIKDLRG